MRTAVVLTALIVAAIVLAAASPGGTSQTALRVTYWGDSHKPNASVTWTLRCNPAGGTLARPVAACRKLATAGVKPFAPLPRGIACTEIYGGPQMARVVGTVSGRSVRATFTRTNGCEIGRWQRISPWLVPAGGITS